MTAIILKLGIETLYHNLFYKIIKIGKKVNLKK